MNAHTRPPVDATPRKGFTKKQRAEAFLKADGRCALCDGKIIGQYDIDHIIALDHGGKHEADNWQVVHRACHVNKTRGDVKVSAKIKRIQKRADGTRRERKKIQSPGFSKTLSKGFDGKVCPRTIALAFMSLGIVVGGLSMAYLAGVSDARPALYTEKPPVRFRGPFTVTLSVLPSVEAVGIACRGRVFGENRSYLVGCYNPSANTIIVPPPCSGGGWFGDLICHEGGHALGWSGEHER